MNTSARVGLAAVVVAVGSHFASSTRGVAVGGEGSPVSGRIAYSSYSGGIYTSTPDGTDPRLIVNGGSDPVWSPDGHWIAYDGDDQSIRRVRADGMSNRPIPIGRDWRVEDPAWSPDGRRVAFTRSWAVKLPDGFQKRYGVYTTRPDGSGIRRLHFGTMPTWSPDGRLIAFRSHDPFFSSNVGLAVIEPDGDGYRMLREDVNPWYLAFAPHGRRLVFDDFPSRDLQH